MNDIIWHKDKDYQGNLTATISGNTVERLWYDDNNSLKGESEMKNTTKSIILAVAVAVITALLLAGCQEGNRTRDPSQKENIEQTEVNADSLEKDSMKAFFERMRRWDALHGGMRQRESDK